MSDRHPPTYHEINRIKDLEDRNQWQAGRIMELEFALHGTNNMKLKENKLIETNNETNVISMDTFRKGLEGGPSGPNENWLKNLQVGTIFNCRNKRAPKEMQFLDLYCVTDQKEETTNLVQKTPDGRQLDFWFKSLEFSRNNDHVETVATITLNFSEEQMKKDMAMDDKADEDQPQKENTDDGEDFRPIR